MAQHRAKGNHRRASPVNLTLGPCQPHRIKFRGPRGFDKNHRDSFGPTATCRRPADDRTATRHRDRSGPETAFRTAPRPGFRPYSADRRTAEQPPDRPAGTARTRLRRPLVRPTELGGDRPRSIVTPGDLVRRVERPRKNTTVHAKKISAQAARARDDLHPSHRGSNPANQLPTTHHDESARGSHATLHI
jgi:hypothetical protein